MQKKVSVFRHEHFNAAHRLYNPDWTNERNDAVFGKCNNPSFHGHNYELVVKITGVPDKETGYVMDLKVLSDLIYDLLRPHIDAEKDLQVRLYETPRNFVEYPA
jgi:6-pyruvoyltetrahydropterin/6-carboxytetrahydropterin synthase